MSVSSHSYDYLEDLGSSIRVDEAALHELLTVIIVTSPIAAHPSTELLDRLLSSLAKNLVGFEYQSSGARAVSVSNDVSSAATRKFGASLKNAPCSIWVTQTDSALSSVGGGRWFLDSREREEEKTHIRTGHR
jgi:hypothetical protein